MTLIGCRNEDISSCTRESLLGFGSTVTAAALIYAFYRRFRSFHIRSNRDLLVLSLSIIQTGLSSIYYVISDNGEIVLAARVLKVLQTLVISWIFLSATFPSRTYIHIICGGAAVQVIIIYSFLIILWDPKTALCRDTIWVLISIAWFVVSLFVSLVGIQLIQSLPTTSIPSGSILVAPEPPENSLDVDDAVQIIDGRPNATKNTMDQHHALKAPFPPLHKGLKRSFNNIISRQPSEERLIIRNLIDSRRLISVPTIDSEDDGISISLHGEDTKYSEIAPTMIGQSTETKQENETNQGSSRSEDSSIAMASMTVATTASASPSKGGSTSSVEGITQLDIKKNHLLALVGIETIAAGVTMIWDVIIWFSVEKDSDNNTCNHVLSNIPYVELVVYIVSRAVSLLIPHWAIFFVFYWFDRNLHLPYSPHWDVDLRGVELNR